MFYDPAWLGIHNKMHIENKAKKPFILQFILLPALICMPLFAQASNHQGDEGNGKHKGDYYYYDHDDHHHKHNKKHKHKGKKYDCDVKKYSSHYDNSLISININFGDVRPVAVNYGLVGYKGLPPGIEKQIRRGKPLPPGIAKKALPASFRACLPTYSGYEWRMSGKDLLLVAIKTAIVAEIIENVFE
ncbi:MULTISPECIES: anti-virulence regulator CigR family protein [unclassified Providencia]|uniref:anti-virulence regulator CigR family protein n=1 Tax=unclassified Providencia TaxID=2633465 RepID=UPI003FA75D7B